MPEDQRSSEQKLTANEYFQPKSLKYKTIFKKYGVPIAHIAPFIGISYTHLVNILNGIARLSPKVEKKLNAVVKKLEGDI